MTSLNTKNISRKFNILIFILLTLLWIKKNKPLLFTFIQLNIPLFFNGPVLPYINKIESILIEIKKQKKYSQQINPGILDTDNLEDKIKKLNNECQKFNYK